MKARWTLWYAVVLVAAVGTGQSADVQYYGVLKSQQFRQEPGDVPQPLPSGAYAFNAVVVPTSAGAVTGAIVRLPGNGGSRTLEPQFDGAVWRFEERFDSATALNQAYPNGSLFQPYTMQIQTTHDGVKSGSLVMSTVSGGFPPTPVIANLEAAQAINVEEDFELRWGSLGGRALDMVQVTVLDGASNVVFASPFPFTDGALDGTATSILIPAGTLPAGTNLVGHLSIGRPGLPNLTYAIGVPALLKDTEFPLTTLPLAVPPVLSLTIRRQDILLLTVETVPRLPCTVEASQDLRQWTPIWTTNPPTDRFVLTLDDPRRLSWRFYRASVGP